MGRRATLGIAERKVLALLFVCASVDRRKANFDEQLLEGWVTVKAAENLVSHKIQHELVMRLDADGQVPDRLAPMAESSLGLRNIIR